MSRRNIPASPLLTLSPSPGRWSSGCGCAVWNEPRALGLGRVCAEAGKEYSGEVPQKLAGRRRLVAGYGGGSVETSVRLPEGSGQEGFSTTCERAAQLYLPEATSGCPSSARAGAPVGAKEVYSVPSAHQSEPSTPASPSAGAEEVYSGPSAHTSKHLKDVQLTTQLC